MANPEFWNDPQAAQPEMIRLAELKDVADTWRALEKRIASAYALLLLALEEGGFRATVMNAVIAAYEKSKALG